MRRGSVKKLVHVTSGMGLPVSTCRVKAAVALTARIGSPFLPSAVVVNDQVTGTSLSKAEISRRETLHKVLREQHLRPIAQIANERNGSFFGQDDD